MSSESRAEFGHQAHSGFIIFNLPAPDSHFSNPVSALIVFPKKPFRCGCVERDILVWRAAMANSPNSLYVMDVAVGTWC